MHGVVKMIGAVHIYLLSALKPLDAPVYHSLGCWTTCATCVNAWLDRAGATSTGCIWWRPICLPQSVADAARLLHLVRLEWGIENGLHYRRDVALAEDAGQLRGGAGPPVMAALNNTVVILVAQQS